MRFFAACFSEQHKVEVILIHPARGRISWLKKKDPLVRPNKLRESYCWNLIPFFSIFWELQNVFWTRSRIYFWTRISSMPLLPKLITHFLLELTKFLGSLRIPRYFCETVFWFFLNAKAKSQYFFLLRC